VRVWDVRADKSLAVNLAGAEVRSVSVPGRDGRFARGTVDGQLHHLRLRNPPWA
jgi:hypothetical protein